jgi:hypothetical protein
MNVSKETQITDKRLTKYIKNMEHTEIQNSERIGLLC